MLRYTDRNTQQQKNPQISGSWCVPSRPFWFRLLILLQVLNIERVKELETWLKTTNTKLTQVNGQRKYGGPPEGERGYPAPYCLSLLLHIIHTQSEMRTEVTFITRLWLFTRFLKWTCIGLHFMNLNRIKFVISFLKNAKNLVCIVGPILCIVSSHELNVSWYSYCITMNVVITRWRYPPLSPLHCAVSVGRTHPRTPLWGVHQPHPAGRLRGSVDPPVQLRGTSLGVQAHDELQRPKPWLRLRQIRQLGWSYQRHPPAARSPDGARLPPQCPPQRREETSLYRRPASRHQSRGPSAGTPALGLLCVIDGLCFIFKLKLKKTQMN